MRHTGPDPSNHAHEHEWYSPRDDSAFYYEDGALHLTEVCEYIEQRSAGHSERLDETFYETMYECDVTRVHRFDLTRIERVESDGSHSVVAEAENVFEMDGVDPSLLEAIESRGAEKCTEATDDHEPVALDAIDVGVCTDDIHVGVTYDGVRYRLQYSWTERNRL